MADTNFYDDTSLSAEKKAGANKSYEGKRGKLFNLLSIWTSGIAIFVIFIDIFYFSSPIEAPLSIIANTITIGYGIILFVILLTTVKDLAREIRKLF